MVPEIAEFLAKRQVDLIDSLWVGLPAPALHLALLIRQRFGSPIFEILDKVESVEDLVSHLTIPLADRGYVLSQVHIFKHVSSRVPMGPLLIRMTASLLIAFTCQAFEAREVIEILVTS
jgi:hypothetical protein